MSGQIAVHLKGGWVPLPEMSLADCYELGRQLVLAEKSANAFWERSHVEMGLMTGDTVLPLGSIIIDRDGKPYHEK